MNPRCGTTVQLFTDQDVHRMLRNSGVRNPDGEWFERSVE
jgi:hypothetical protein